MKETSNSPYPHEPETTYAEQVGVERVRQAETGNCPKTSFAESLVAIVCPCVSVARVASSIGSSCALILLAFALVYLLGLAGTMVGTTYFFDGPIGFGSFVVSVIFKFIVFIAGPLISLVFMIIYYVHENSDNYSYTDYTVLYVFLPSIASDIVLACAAQLIRNRLRRRIGVPQDGIWRVLFNAMCSIWYNLASTATSSSKFKSVSIGALDTIPPYEPSEKQAPKIV